MKSPSATLPFLALALAGLLLAWTGAAWCGSDEAVTDFLPTSAVTEAVYVEIERDPGFDDFARRMQEAREKRPQWNAEYYREHGTDDRSPLPYHENFGVEREEYEHYAQPMNHFLEVARQEIRIRRSERDGRIVLELEGEDLLLPRLVIDPESDTVTTPTDVLVLRSFVDLDLASLPPGVHRGVLFRTPDSRIRQTRSRESLLIGEVPQLDIGIFHFGLRTPEGNRRIYVRFPL